MLKLAKMNSVSKANVLLKLIVLSYFSRDNVNQQKNEEKEFPALHTKVSYYLSFPGRDDSFLCSGKAPRWMAAASTPP